MKKKTARNNTKKDKKAKKNGNVGLNTADIAVIGMACRLPGAGNYEEFWENLKHGRSSIREIPPER